MFDWAILFNQSYHYLNIWYEDNNISNKTKTRQWIYEDSPVKPSAPGVRSSLVEALAVMIVLSSAPWDMDY